MFEKLFKYPAVLVRHRNAPYAKDRQRYLEHCAQQGYTHSTLLFMARELLWVARKLSVYPNLKITQEQINAVAKRWGQRQRWCGQKLNAQWCRQRFIQTARGWLRFLGCMKESFTPLPFADVLDAFIHCMKQERGLAPSTIHLHHLNIGQFLRWLLSEKLSLSKLHVSDVDRYLAIAGSGRWSRVTINNHAGSIRAFLRFTSGCGLSRPKMADAIQGPRLFSQETLPCGPSWQDVNRLLVSMETNRPYDVRDQAIIMLFAIYGLRASEVSGLRLENIDWEHDRILVLRAKRREPQTYPLLASVGNAIAHYLRTVRPQSSLREVFLMLHAPFRPLTRGAVYSLVKERMVNLRIHTVHKGPHSLRHACAAHLVSEGFSLKEIGDHLGHHSSSATRIYAKVDLPALRQVAAFDLGELL